MKLYKAHAKVNIFLKITGKRDNYHEIFSRFMRVDNLYDMLCFIPKEKENQEFIILGDCGCETTQNTIYKAFIALKDYTKSKSLEKLMRTHAIKVDKSIPSFAGLGGGSSDAATYIKMCNEVLHLGLSLNELASIGVKVGADVAFFIYGYNSANVSGIGEIVESFDEESLEFEIYTPDVMISTPKVYQTYRESFYNPIDNDKINIIKNKSSKEILESMTCQETNDLFSAAIQVYPELKKHYKLGYHFSGSGSSFFKIKGK